MIVHTAYDQLQISVPGTAYQLDGFRAWVYSDQFPESGQITYCEGQVFVDMSPEKFDTHNQVKAEVNRVLAMIVRDRDMGDYCPDGVWLTNDDADLSTEPDGTFLSWQTFEEQRIKLVPGSREDYDGIELQGSPDWVMEVISNSSVTKDTKVLFHAYHRAGVREYWLIDARGSNLSFRVFQNGPDGFTQVDPIDGWIESSVFSQRLRLSRDRNRIGHWQYTLETNAPAKPGNKT